MWTGRVTLHHYLVSAWITRCVCKCVFVHSWYHNEPLYWRLGFLSTEGEQLSSAESNYPFHIWDSAQKYVSLCITHRLAVHLSTSHWMITPKRTYHCLPHCYRYPFHAICHAYEGYTFLLSVFCRCRTECCPWCRTKHWVLLFAWSGNKQTHILTSFPLFDIHVLSMWVCLCPFRQNTTPWHVTLVACVWSSTMSNSVDQSLKIEPVLRWMRVCIHVSHMWPDLFLYCLWLSSYIIWCDIRQIYQYASVCSLFCVTQRLSATCSHSLALTWRCTTTWLQRTCDVKSKPWAKGIFPATMSWWAASQTFIAVTAVGYKCTYFRRSIPLSCLSCKVSR